jgi:predicted small lipoprotein YifL
MRTWITGLVTILLLSIGIAGCGKKKEEAPEVPETPAEMQQPMPTDEEKEEIEKDKGEMEDKMEEKEEELEGHLHEGSGTR